MGPHTFTTIAIILAIAAVVGMIATRLRQPLIVAFNGVGILVGPTGAGWVVADGSIELLHWSVQANRVPRRGRA